MVIYGEYLFIENFIVGFVLLLLTGRLVGYMPVLWHLIAGSMLCGISGFMIFLNMSPAADAAVRVIFLMSVVVVTFGRSEFLKTAALFMVLSFLSGGAVMALLLWQQEPAITHQGIVYIDVITYFKLLCFGILAFGFTYWFVKFIRGRRAQLSINGNVCLIIEDRRYFFKAFVDSGNSLREPTAGKPVILIDEKGAEKLNFKARDLPTRYTLIPYKAVGVDYGYLEGVRTDAVLFREKRIEGACMAFYRGNFQNYDVLLSRDFLEGGLLENAKGV